MAEKVAIEEKLLTIVVNNYSLIWDKRHPFHSNKYHVKSAWDQIFKEIGENSVVKSSDDCAKLFKTIRSQYSSFQGRLKRKSGQGAETQPTFRHAGLMKIMKDSCDKPRTFTNAITVDDQSQDITMQVPTDVSQESVKSTHEEDQSQQASTSRTEEGGFRVEKVKLPDRVNYPVKRKKEDTKHDVQMQLIEVLKNSFEKKQGHFLEFGGFVVKVLMELREIDEIEADEAAADVLTLLVKRKKELMKDKRANN